ncbi:MAG: hypothetical protein WDO24_20660 [Pseudomonadota bacterium]
MLQRLALCVDMWIPRGDLLNAVAIRVAREHGEDQSWTNEPRFKPLSEGMVGWRWQGVFEVGPIEIPQREALRVWISLNGEPEYRLGSLRVEEATISTGLNASSIVQTIAYRDAVSKKYDGHPPEGFDKQVIEFLSTLARPVSGTWTPDIQ